MNRTRRPFQPTKVEARGGKAGQCAALADGRAAPSIIAMEEDLTVFHVKREQLTESLEAAERTLESLETCAPDDGVRRACADALDRVRNALCLSIEIGNVVCMGEAKAEKARRRFARIHAALAEAEKEVAVALP